MNTELNATENDVCKLIKDNPSCNIYWLSEQLYFSYGHTRHILSNIYRKLGIDGKRRVKFKHLKRMLMK